MVSNNTQGGFCVDIFCVRHYTTSTLNHWYQVEWTSAVILFAPNSDLAIQLLQQKLSFIRPDNIFPIVFFSNYVEPVWTAALFPVLSGQELYLVWSSAAIAHLFQGLMCAFRDAHLHTLVVTSGCLSYSFFPIRLKPSGHSPLNSDMIHTENSHSLHTFLTILCKSLGKSQQISCCWNIPAYMAPPIIPGDLNSLSSPFWCLN